MPAVFQLRLGGHGAAAMTLWWLEDGLANGLLFDQAALDFQVPQPLLAISPFDMELQELPASC